MEDLISNHYLQCHSTFERLTDATSSEISRPAHRHAFANTSEEFVKFKLWAGNMGAAHAGSTFELSLDYRLREASFFKQQVSGVIDPQA